MGVGSVKQVGFKPGVKERGSYGWAEWWIKRERSDGWRNRWVGNRRTGTRMRLMQFGFREAYQKEWSVIFREDDVGGQARLTTDEERVLRGRWTEMRLWRYGGLVVVQYGSDSFLGVSDSNEHVVISVGAVSHCVCVCRWLLRCTLI